jgi:small subunit ribosomal protein S13
MARIAGVEIPTNKQVQHSLRYVFGIGHKQAVDICKRTQVEVTARVKDLTEAELNRIRDDISNNVQVEGDLRRVVAGNIKRLKDIGAYRGTRHKLGLPTRGQRSKTNARTRKGKKVSVGGTQPKAATKT